MKRAATFSHFRSSSASVLIAAATAESSGASIEATRTPTVRVSSRFIFIPLSSETIPDILSTCFAMSFRTFL